MNAPHTGDAATDLRAAWLRAAKPDRDRARVRLRTVLRAKRLAAAGMPKLQADRIVAAQAGVSASTVGGWRRRIARAPEWIRVAALLDRPRTGRPPSIGPVERKELEALLVEHGPRLTARLAHRMLGERLRAVPPVYTIRRWLRQWR